MGAFTAIGERPLSADEFARLPSPLDGSRQELVRGEVVAVPPPGFVHGYVQGNVLFALKGFLASHPLGRATGESGVVTEFEPDSVRGPDVAYWSFDRLPRNLVPSVYAEATPDLCVEIKSPSNTAQKLMRKTREYLAAGVKMVWVVDPEDRTVAIYRKPGDGRVLWDDATLDGEDVLPGFACPVASFFQ